MKDSRIKAALIYGILCVVAPGFVLWGTILQSDRSYIWISLLVALATCIAIGLSFERHTTHIRRIVLIAVMTTFSVIGRFLFYAIPGFKPMTAIIIVTALYLGKEAGFLTGAFTALVSNIYFGQGPWTPFQMLSFGLMGLTAGIFAKPLKQYRWLLLLYGVFAGIAYSFIMDIWTVLWYDQGFSTNLYRAALVSAVPYTCMYALSNVVFLYFLAKPFGKKLQRIVIKYKV